MFSSLIKNAGLAVGLASALLLAGCGKEEAPVDLKPVAFHDGDECHVCGMIIGDFPGPKGEAIEQNGTPRKFCSIAEMMGWYLQPENKLLTAKLYVHDTARTQWAKPQDQFLIDATTAYYVLAPELKGSMGAPLAAFAEKEDAEHFSFMQDGSPILRFADITPEFLQKAATTGPADMSGMDHSKMGHAMPSMDHSQMGDMKGMDHSQMGDMKGMDHSAMPGMSHETQTPSEHTQH